MPQAYTGNDVVDLLDPLRREHFRSGLTEAEPEWLERHLTARERFDLLGAADVFTGFWRTFAAKEAAWKALAQAGTRLPDGAWRLLEVDWALKRVLCLPTGRKLAIESITDDPVHCVVTLGEAPRGLRWAIEPLPPGRDPSDFVREALSGSLGTSYAVVERDGVPRLLQAGEWRDWSVSLSHSGRFVAYSLIASP